MGFSRSNETGPVGTPGPNLCVWMRAGLLSYQLCERDLDCDRCPLDAALRRHFSRPRGRDGAVVSDAAREGGAVRDAAPPSSVTSEGAAPGDACRYGRHHTWFRPGAGDDGSARTGRLGLEPGLAAMLLGPREVVLHGRGASVDVGEALLWLVTDGGTFSIPSPCGGRVVATNPALTTRPHLLADDPLGDGWVLDLEVTDPEIDGAGLLDRPAAEAAWRGDRMRFEAALTAALQGPAPDIGPTLADGGRPLQRLSDMLGAERYYALVKHAFLRR